MSTTGKIYLGDILVSDPEGSGSGSSVEYVTVTFKMPQSGTIGKGCLIFWTDEGYRKIVFNNTDTNNMIGTTINVVKDSFFLAIVGVVPNSVEVKEHNSQNIITDYVDFDLYSNTFNLNSCNLSFSNNSGYISGYIATQDMDIAVSGATGGGGLN